MTVSSCKWTVILLLGTLCLLSGCASGREVKDQRPPAHQPDGTGPVVAVLPLYNVTAAPAPLGVLEVLIRDTLQRYGVPVLEGDVLENFMAGRRVRYTGGIDAVTASAMREETGAEAVLISTLEFLDENTPPRISLHSRLVSTGHEPEIYWGDSVCMAGDDAPGFLDLGVIDDPREMIESAVDALAKSLALYLAGGRSGAAEAVHRKGIRPTISYLSPVWKAKEESTVAVMPFYNLSGRSYAWEILPLHFVQPMVGLEGYRVMEPGVVRLGLLRSRVMVRGGLTKPHLELVLRSTDADLVLTGTVFSYLDGQFATSGTEVEFSVQVYERESKKVVWSSRSVGRGDDGVFFFGVGRRSTACMLAAELAQGTVAELTQRTGARLKTSTGEGVAP